MKMSLQMEGTLTPCLILMFRTCWIYNDGVYDIWRKGLKALKKRGKTGKAKKKKKKPVETRKKGKPLESEQIGVITVTST